MFKKAQGIYSEAAGPHAIAFKPTLRWHRGSSNPAEPTISVSSKIQQCAVFVYQCAIALATRGRAPPPTHPKSFTLLVFSRFWGSGAGKKDAKTNYRCFWKLIWGRCWTIFWRPFAAPGKQKHRKIQCFCPFRILTLHLATWWKVRKYQHFCWLTQKHCKYRGFKLQKREKHRYVQCCLLRACQKNAKNTVYLTIVRGPQKCENI